MAHSRVYLAEDTDGALWFGILTSHQDVFMNRPTCYGCCGQNGDGGYDGELLKLRLTEGGAQQ
jgi:hypothetical protein